MKRFRRFAAAAALFLLLPIPAAAETFLVPGGNVVGLRLGGDTVTVAAYDDSSGGVARDAGVKIGDELVKIGDSPISSAQDVSAALAAQPGEITLTLRRDGKERTVRLTPEQTEDGPRLGVYLRQGIAGLGTVTFYDPATHQFGALGHGVSDSRGSLLTLGQGSACLAAVESVRRGQSGSPGQLKGSADGTQVCGILQKNTPQGVFGVWAQGFDGETVAVGEYAAIHTGEAMIRSTIQGNTVGEYCVEILKIYPQSRSDGRNLLLRVTDPALLEATGGIVQGMSGSPILQDGKLIGAVTHVLVNDAAVGYGIYIGNMLAAAA